MTLLTAFAIVLTAPTTAFAWGEIFPIKVSGWEHCADGRAVRLTARTAIPLWVRLTDGDIWDVSLSPTIPADPQQTFQMFVAGAVPFKSNKFAFIADGFFFEGEDIQAYIVITGYLQVDRRTGGWKSMRGNFSNAGTFEFQCWSSGKIRTGRRLN
jgi:hypothetical protein